jgi:Protein of unknown function (DUF3179)
MRRPLLFVALTSGLAGALAADAPKGALVEEPKAFPTLVRPDCSHCVDEAKRRKHELRDDDRLLCWIRGKYDGGAVQQRFFLNTWRVISDTYGVFVHDPEAGYSRAFAPSLDFTFHGWRDGVMVIKHKDGTLFSALSGVGLAGKRKGERLEPLATLVSDWGWWSKHYPDTVSFHLYAKYKPVAAPTKPAPGSLKSRGKADGRLGAEERVLGVSAGKSARAFPIAQLAKKKLIADKVGEQPCVVLYYAPTRTAAAYAPTASPPKPGQKPRSLTLEADAGDKEAGFKDRETASSWDVTGRCVKGKLKGWVLAWLDGVEVKWFAWAAEYPDTTIYGK